MIRDARMQALVSGDKEPITPFIGRVRCLFEQQGVSSILVVGGAGDYFDVADRVVMMDCYAACDRTAQAKAIAEAYAASSSSSAAAVAGHGLLPPTPPPPVGVGASSGGAGSNPFAAAPERVPLAQSFSSGGGKVTARGKWKLTYGERELELGGVEQIVEESQTRAIGDAISVLSAHVMAKRGGGGAGGSAAAGSGSSIGACLDRLEGELTARGLDALSSGGFPFVGNYARPRRVEVAAALNRLRGGAFAQRPASASASATSATSATSANAAMMSNS